MPKNKKKNNKQRPQQRPAKKQNQNRWVIIVSTVFVLILVFAIVGIVINNKHNDAADTSQSSNQEKASSGQASYKNFDYNDQPSLGEKDAPVKIAEFGDYKCPYCKQFELSIFPKLEKDYIDTGKVQFYFFNYILFGNESWLAAEAAESIYHNYPEHFWDFHQLLYKNQGAEDKAWVTKDLLKKIAKQAVPNLDVKKLQWDMDHNTYEDNITKDITMGGQGLGTPTLFLNGKVLSTGDTFDYKNLKKQIDQALNAGE
ncbi:disulfide bond formation protein D [Pullulanibacillus camelliae]|uniref:Disulfide bond formation protein D n=1 Tax=Pullulanibacillus camelliae TaxID=1707096 RepID=A0A8J2VNM7_9BACL|nr:thioredoxin domain-containing protein [Pullulanibacillus camelliae]GGE34209.1 disulfide bond formation protein D [Pullulanibacillus camelliae]